MPTRAFTLAAFDAQGPGKATGCFANYRNSFAGDLGRARLGNQTEVARFESRTVRQDTRALDRVLEFADVARPAARVQRGDTRVTERRFPAPHFLAELCGKMVREQQHVFAAFTQRR